MDWSIYLYIVIWHILSNLFKRQPEVWWLKQCKASPLLLLFLVYALYRQQMELRCDTTFIPTPVKCTHKCREMFHLAKYLLVWAGPQSAPDNMVTHVSESPETSRIISGWARRSTYAGTYWLEVWGTRLWSVVSTSARRHHCWEGRTSLGSSGRWPIQLWTTSCPHWDVSEGTEIIRIVLVHRNHL